MCQDSFPHNSWKTPPSSVERGCWGRVQQPLCFISPGMFIYLASIKHHEAWDYALSNSEYLRSKTRSICFCVDAKGTEDKNYIYQYLEMLKYGLAYRTFIKTMLEHNFILERSCESLNFFSPLFSESVLKHLFFFFNFPNSFLPRPHLCFSPPSPLTIFLDTVWSEVNPVASLPAVQCFSCYLPLDCVEHR